MVHMESPRSRSPLSIALTFFALFAGGIAAGVALAWTFAPGSQWAEAVSAFAFPLAFAFGLQAWFGLALVGLFAQVTRRLIGRAAPPPRPSHVSIPGSVAFVPIASGIGALAGLVVGWLSPTRSVWLVGPVYWLLGTLYGLLAWRLARAGFLVPPESV